MSPLSHAPTPSADALAVERLRLFARHMAAEYGSAPFLLSAAHLAGLLAPSVCGCCRREIGAAELAHDVIARQKEKTNSSPNR